MCLGSLLLLLVAVMLLLAELTSVKIAGVERELTHKHVRTDTLTNTLKDTRKHTRTRGRVCFPCFNWLGCCGADVEIKNANIL